MTLRIVSGGQTGTDRAAFDAAIALGMPMGGWVPRGRLDEDGPIPARYPDLCEADSPEPAVRTELNVRNSDATLVLSHGELRGGSALTVQLCQQLGRPVLHVDLARNSLHEGGVEVRAWLARIQPKVLNVAGPRHREDPTVYDDVYALLIDALSPAVELKPSAIEGLGVFATRRFSAEDLIRRINVVREITADAPLRADLGERLEHQSYPDDRVVLIGPPDRHVNHSCDPNAYKRFEGDAVYSVARRLIEAGEEITYDYVINAAGGNTWPCHCGASRCRGETVGDFFELPEEIQREYRPLLAPWFVARHRRRLDGQDEVER